MDPLDLITRVAGWFIPIVDRVLRRRKEGKKGRVRLEVELPEGRMHATRIDVQLSVHVSPLESAQLQPVLDLLRAGRLQEALASAGRLEAAGLKDFRMQNFKAIALYRLRQYRESLEAARAAHRVAPRDPAVLVNIANALRKLDRRRTAISWYRRSISADGSYVIGWFGLADAQREMGHPSAALRSYDRAIQIDSSRSDSWNNRALALVDLKDYPRAEESFLRAVEIWPEHVHSLGNLAKLVAGLRRYEESIDYAERALRLDPDHITAWHSKAFSLSKSKRFKEAAEAYREVLRRQPGDGAALAHLGSLEVTLGDFNNAEAHLNGALQSGYEPGRVYVDLASLGFRQNRLRDGAKLTARALVRRQPGWARSIAYANMAFALAKSGRLRQAVASARQAIYYNPENGDAWNNLAACLLQLGDMQRSEAAVDHAISLQPDNQSFRTNKEELRRARTTGSALRVVLSERTQSRGH